MEKLDFRKIILDRLKELGPGFNRLWLTREMDGKPKQSQIYNYLAGTNDMATEHVERMFAILGLGVLPTRKTARKGEKKAHLPPELPL